MAFMMRTGRMLLQLVTFLLLLAVLYAWFFFKRKKSG